MRSEFLNKVLILWFSFTALMCLAKNPIVRAEDIDVTLTAMREVMEKSSFYD